VTLLEPNGLESTGLEPTGGLTIRTAEPAEFDIVGALTVGAFDADGQLDGENAVYGRELADVAPRASAGEVLVAVDRAGAVVGAVTFVLPGSAYSVLAGPGEAEFRALAVSPDAQGAGIGAALVQACVERARALGRSAIMICTRDRNVLAQRLYARAGFVRVPERDFSPRPGVHLVALRLDLAVAG
jgi:ribosomal protein S18 acetylase RimI-like enzyme